MGPRSHAAIAATLLLAAPSTAQADITRTGKTFVVTLHPGKLGEELAGRLADEALAAAESTRPVLDKLYQRPAKPPTIHVYASLEEYEPLSRDMYVEFVRDAVCRPTKAASYVLIRPVLPEPVLAEVGLPESTRDHIVMQAAMLAACDRSELARSDPWCAEVFAVGVLEATVYAAARDGDEPARDSSFWWLAREKKAGRGRTLRRLSGDTGVAKTRPEHDGDLEGRAAIARLFASTGGAWARKLLSAPVKDYRRIHSQRLDTVQAVLGTDEKRNEDRFAKLLTTSAPRFRMHGPLVALRGGKLLLAAGRETAGVGGACPPPDGPYAVRATVQLVESARNDCDFALDYDLTTWMEWTCQPAKITVTLRTQGGESAAVTSFPAPIEVGKPFTLSLEVGATVRTIVDGTPVGDVPKDGRTWGGDWWVGKVGGLVWLENLRCESLAVPAKK